MEKLPNTVHDRLSASPASNHPDAELLNAFAEQVASERERISVLNHLAGCSACREILALSAPELSPVAATPSPKRSIAVAAWFRWPTLRWASMAACVVVVGAAATLWRTERHSQLAMTPQSAVHSAAYSPSAKQVAPESQTAANLTQKAEATLPSKEESRASLEKREAKGKQGQLASPTYDALTATNAKRAPAAPAPAPMRLEDRKREFALDADKPSREIAENKQASAPATNLNNELVLKGEPVHIDTLTSSVGAATITSSDQSQKKSNDGASTPVIAQSAAGAKAGLSQQNLAERAAIAPGASIMKDLVNARWTLSPDGLPQRSLDSGKTWEKMHVDNLSGFRALSAAGLEVWVGGLGGLLYHTNDVGMHWSRVKPTVEGTPLSADILRIDFVDAQHGKLVTADQHVWSTADAGKTWQRN